MNVINMYVLVYTYTYVCTYVQTYKQNTHEHVHACRYINKYGWYSAVERETMVCISSSRILHRQEGDITRHFVIINLGATQISCTGIHH